MTFFGLAVKRNQCNKQLFHWGRLCILIMILRHAATVEKLISVVAIVARILNMQSRPSKEALDDEEAIWLRQVLQHSVIRNEGSS